MADILEKDLDAWDTSVIATNPFFLKPSEVSKEKYISGEDLARSIRITEQLKDPVELRALAYHPSSIAKQMGESAFGEAVDRAGNFVPNVKNWVSQLAIQTLNNEPISKPYQDKLKEFGIDWKTIADVSDQEKIIEMLDGSVYPVRKYFKRILAESTDTIEKRKIIRELYNQSHGVDSEKWYNTLSGVVGGVAVLPIPAKAAGSIARLAGGSRYAVAKTAENVARGVVMAEEAGGFTAETAAEYLERTGDKTFENFTPNDASGLLASLYGYVSQKIEFMGDMDLMLVGAIRKVGIRKPLSRVAVEGGLKEWGEEVLQNISRLAFKKIEGTDQTWAEGMKEALTNSVYALPVGGLMAPAGYYINRRNLVKGIKMAVPNITDTQAVQVADAMIDSAAESVMPDPTLRNNLREKVALMYRDIDMDNKDDRIDAMTDLEYSLIAIDAIDRGIDIADHELFQGVVNELGWFRAGIPEAEMGKIESINNNIRELRTQLEELNKAEEKDWAKIEETENKLAQASQYVLENLTDVRKAFQELEDKYVEKEFKATPEQIELSGKTATDIFDTLSDEGVDIQFANQGKTTKDAATYLQINRKGAKSFQIRFGVSPIGPLHPSVVANFNVETLTQEQILQHIRTLIENKYPRTNKKAKEGVNIGFDNQPMFQDQFDLADENARLDDIYPEYTGETIEVDGKERTVYNSNGDRIAKSKEALTNFWRWFGDSKVVDEQGRPLVVYHGTDAEFDTFDKNITPKRNNLLGQGFYFTNQQDKAKWFGKNIMPVYLKIENPETNAKIFPDIEKMKQSGKDGIIKDQTDILETEPITYVAFEPTQIKSVDNRGTYSADTGNIYWQNRVSGAAPKTYRGAYIPEYRFILRANKMDASTLSHELAHDWMEVNFDRYRSGKQGKQGKDFMKAWGALEKALGIPEDAISVPPKASETFARAYEAWIVQNEDWSKLIAVEDKDKDAVEKLMKDYQGELRDIYNDITSPYFKQTWGKIGELKPELKAWFDRVVNITDLDTMVERGEMTESQATNEKLNRAIDTVIENTTDSDTKQALTEAKVLNDTSRYEVEGGNKNSIQQRLSILAKDIDENNMVLKGEKYDTRRDMMQVAEAADNFVKTRLDDALAIINGEMAETEGLYKEDLYTALERLAVENGDLNLIDELKNSEVANRLAKELGQRVAGFRNIKQSTDIDVVSALKSLDMKFNKALDNKKAKQQYDAALKLLDESIKQQDKIADKELDNFLKELECK